VGCRCTEDAASERHCTTPRWALPGILSKLGPEEQTEKIRPPR
jgi:hypothetical protein